MVLKKAFSNEKADDEKVEGYYNNPLSQKDTMLSPTIK